MRSINWRSDKPSSLYWAETQDGGDAKVDVSPRDIIYTQSAEPKLSEEPEVLHKLDLCFGGISWGDDYLAMVYESWYKTRRTRTWVISPGDRGEEDNNSGTLTMQSEWFFTALKGHGSLCRLVLLPFESHGYNSHESIMHLLYETGRRIHKFCVNSQGAKFFRVNKSHCGSGFKVQNRW